MALTDIHFQEAEVQDFIVEIPVGTLEAPIDILFEPSSQYLVMELVLVGGGGGGNIFIMSE